MTQDIVPDKKKNIDIVFPIDKREEVGYNRCRNITGIMKELV